MYLRGSVPDNYANWLFLLYTLTDIKVNVSIHHSLPHSKLGFSFQLVSSLLFYPGYTGIFKRRTGSYTDGCAVFYSESRLKLLEWKGFEYQCKSMVLNRDNVAVLAKFAFVDEERRWVGSESRWVGWFREPWVGSESRWVHTCRQVKLVEFSLILVGTTGTQATATTKTASSFNSHLLATLKNYTHMHPPSTISCFTTFDFYDFNALQKCLKRGSNPPHFTPIPTSYSAGILNERLLGLLGLRELAQVPQTHHMYTYSNTL